MPVVFVNFKIPMTSYPLSPSRKGGLTAGTGDWENLKAFSHAKQQRTQSKASNLLIGYHPRPFVFRFSAYSAA